MTERIAIALLFGGRSAEHDVSLESAAAVFTHLDRDRYHVSCIYINREGRWRRVASPQVSAEERAAGVFAGFLPWSAPPSEGGWEADIYFPVLHGPYGEDGTMQGLFEMAGVPYVGAAVLASAVGMDKAVAKALFAERGLPLVTYRVFRERDWRKDPRALLRQVRESFTPPFFVKPANLGSSVGITKVKTADAAGGALETAFRHDAKVLVEEGITGREIECSVLGNDEPAASVSGEVFPYREFYDYRDKYIEGKTRFAVPADLSTAQEERIRRLAVEAFRAIDGSGMARVDFFIQQGTERIYLNEINTIPGFTGISMYPKLWEASGLSFPDLLDKLIALGFERHAQRKRKAAKT